MFVTWKVSDIIEVIKSIIYLLCILAITPVFFFFYAILIIVCTSDTLIEDLTDLIEVEPLTYDERKEMGQLHHCKVYQD